MNRILITGANGFIGSFLVEEAKNQDYSVWAGVRATSNLKHLDLNNISLFEVDLSDKQAIKKKLTELDSFDYIIHNAGITKTCSKDQFISANLHNTQNLIEALRETNRFPKKFIYISSLAAYGPGQPNGRPIKLTDKPAPVSVYGMSKLKAEEYIKSVEGLNYLIFRPTGVYGPREEDYYVMYKSIKAGIETYIGSTEQYISFIYVKDLANLVIKSLDSEIVNKSYFVSDLEKYTAIEFNEILKQELNAKTIRLVFPFFFVKFIAVVGELLSCFFAKKIPTLNTEKYKDISHRNWYCDSRDLVNDFDFQPKYYLKKGINETIQWYKKRHLL